MQYALCSMHPISLCSEVGPMQIQCIIMLYIIKKLTVCEHFDKLANLCEQLAAMGKSVPETEYASILIELLPILYAGMLGLIAASAEMSTMPVSPTIVIKLA
jgi:hypothetical protein